MDLLSKTFQVIPETVTLLIVVENELFSKILFSKGSSDFGAFLSGSLNI